MSDRFSQSGEGPADPFAGIRCNEAIAVPEVRVIAADGSQLGILRTGEALQRALLSRLDLVEVAPQATPPVCRIMNFAAYMREARRKRADLPTTWGAGFSLGPCQSPTRTLEIP